MSIPIKELKIFGVVYKITNLINGKIYFGITKGDINKRWNQHKYSSVNKKKKAYINHAINKHGNQNFKIELFKTCYTSSQLYSSEQYFIRIYNTTNKEIGYNNSIGGEISTLGMKMSDEAKAKISKYNKGRKRRPHSEESKELMRLKAKGRNTDRIVRISSEKRKGVPLTEERKAKMSLAHFGKHEHEKKPVSMFTKDGLLVRTFSGVLDASKQLNIYQSSISNALTKRYKTAGGYKWEYL